MGLRDRFLRLQARDDAKAGADLLDADPAGWTWDSHIARHASTEIEVWVANRAYACDWSVGYLSVVRGRLHRVTSFGSASQKLVWRAFQRLRGGAQSGARETRQRLAGLARRALQARADG